MLTTITHAQAYFDSVVLTLRLDIHDSRKGTSWPSHRTDHDAIPLWMHAPRIVR
jgi:hypothetical protein